MRDLRTLDIEDRRALALEAERRAWCGETPAQICAALDLSISTYHRWAALFGFRLSDRVPGHKMGRAKTPSGVEGRKSALPDPEALARQAGEEGSVSHSARAHMNRAAGADSLTPSSRYPSGRFMLGEGLGGRVPGSGRRPHEDVKAKAADYTKEEMLAQVHRLRAAGALSELDLWLSAWRAARRREKLIGDLEREVNGFAESERQLGPNGDTIRTEAEIKAMSDDELDRYLVNLMTGQTRVDLAKTLGVEI